jgi:hypothetical protein
MCYHEAMDISFDSKPLVGYEIDVKRFKLPVVVKGKCPDCGGQAETDLEEHPLSYPKLGAPENISLYCSKCDEYWEATIIVHMSILPAWQNEGS